jgi:hypothetical protein
LEVFGVVGNEDIVMLTAKGGYQYVCMISSNKGGRGSVLFISATSCVSCLKARSFRCFSVSTGVKRSDAEWDY